MVNIVNTVKEVDKALMPLRHELAAAEIKVQVGEGTLQVDTPSGAACFRMVALYRPSSADVEKHAAPDVVLVLSHASDKAVQAARHHNHLSLPQGSARLVAPGVALLYDPGNMRQTAPSPRQVRLQGQSGVVAESLLLGGPQRWTVQGLSTVAKVSPGLAHRVLARLQREGLTTSTGKGPGTTRAVSNPQALAELWSQEETAPTVLLRGFLYAPSLEIVARKVLERYPDGAVGGVLAANLSLPTLTRVPPPIRFWVDDGFDPETLKSLGFQEASEGVNIEFIQAKSDPWRVHRSAQGTGDTPKVSRWRAWLEVAALKGRTEELANALLADLVKG